MLQLLEQLVAHGPITALIALGLLSTCAVTVLVIGRKWDRIRFKVGRWLEFEAEGRTRNEDGDREEGGTAPKRLDP